MTPPDRWIQRGFLFGFSSFAFSLLLFPIEANTVLNTYAAAALKLLADVSPYTGENPAFNQFNYPPFFALFFAAILKIARFFPVSELNATFLIWQWLNATIFWLGICRWWKPERMGGTEALLILATCLELFFSMGYAQSNALLAGLSLLALGLSARSVFMTAFCVVGLSNLKVYPLLLLAFLANRKNAKQVLLGAVAGECAVCLLLILVAGTDSVWNWHAQWFEIFSSQLGGTGNLDIQTALSELGLTWPGMILQSFIALIFALIAALTFLGRYQPSSWQAYAWTFLTLLLISPRTEKPTFVLAAPLFLLMEKSAVGPKRAPGWVLLGATLIVLGGWHNLNDSAPLSRFKAVGALLLWGYLAVGKIRLPSNCRVVVAMPRDGGG